MTNNILNTIPNSVTLVAASKTRTAKTIREAYTSGITNFGENYLQEALPKVAELSDLDITWHFIGAIQSKKCEDIAKNFKWAHGVDRLKVAESLNKHSKIESPLNICIQVNIDEEPQKSGVLPKDLYALACKIKKLPHLKLRGLMVLPKHRVEVHTQRECFKKVKALFDELNLKGFELDTLSMGMSNDYKAAISEGATIIRLGTKIFGPRI